MLLQIGGDLKKSINKAGLGKQVEAYQVCGFWNKVVEEIFTKEVAEKSQAIKYKDGTLTVAVLNSVFAQEFKFKEDEIKNEMNKEIGYKAVRKIRFEL
ncbi:MAG: DUF721 domain-containing protein [Candidatus Pacebacteria bacterium]|nr:DUF721 domain-containing protein [Candidatus Paceibacterota bacterium]